MSNKLIADPIATTIEIPIPLYKDAVIEMQLHNVPNWMDTNIALAFQFAGIKCRKENNSNDLFIEIPIKINGIVRKS